MRSRSSTAVGFASVMTLLMIPAGPLAQNAGPSGAESPQAVVDVLKKAADTKDFLGALQVISPAGLKEVAKEGVVGVVLLVALSNPDDPMPGAPKPSSSELAAKRKQYKQVLMQVSQTLKPYGLDTLIGKPVMGTQAQKSLDAALDKADNFALITSLYGVLPKLAPMVGMKEDPTPELPVKVGTVNAYKVNGDRATARNDGQTIDFIRINGRWYLEPSAAKAPGAPASPLPSSTSDEAQAGAAGRSTASRKEPEIVVGGLQIVRVLMPRTDFSARPFNSDNGTSIVLWVKMPAGQGLLEIDDDESLLESLTDDRGSSIGGKFESFPDEFEDGSGGIIEIESSGLPSPGATAVLAQGSLAMRVASGTRKTRVVSVRLQNATKFMFGKTPIVVDDVEDGGRAFTLKLPRQVMTEIKDVVFLDATGEPIKSRRAGGGYMNDDAHMTFRFETPAKTVTLEIESWQSMRTIKVPFRVKAGIGLH